MAFSPEGHVLAPSEFDWNAAEAQFPTQPVMERPPEAEIYGRSLSTVHRLGSFAVRHSLAETLRSPEAAQAKVEFFTSVEEGFGTDKELGGGLEVRDFDERPVHGGRVMSKDLKTAISHMTASGLRCAEEKYTVERALGDERFLPQLVRSHWDHQNALIVDDMVQGKTGYNTRIVVSPFPEEAAARSGDAYWRNIGYVPRNRRGFAQLYHIGADGQALLAGSLSFDGSDKRQLRQVFAEAGVDVPEGEVTDNWLKYAITGNYTAEQAKVLATKIANVAADPQYRKNTNTVDVTKQHRVLMERVFDESYVHIGESLVRGRQTAGARQLVFQLANNAQYFNGRYATALRQLRAKESFSDDDSIVLHELLVYSTIEMMRALHIGKTKGNSSAMTHQNLQAIDAQSFQSLLSDLGADGARHNRGYSACGLEIAAGEDKSEGGDPQAAFAGHGKLPQEDDLGHRWFTCPKGHLNYRRVANVKEKSCTSCGVSVGCETPKAKATKSDKRMLTRELLFGTKRNENKRLRMSLGKQAVGI
ncbi:MAG TPA: hypothetical protein VLF59_02610 [Candidatus Saccharimonadales bacterium]|nr:hypothetical protein [Candidatus Saccharimonadales bacterium]